MSGGSDQLAQRFVAWTRRWSLAIVLVHLALLAGSAYLVAYHLPLRADFSYLLPQDAPAVRDLRRLEDRVEAGDVVLAIVEAPDAEERAAATRELAAGLRAISHDLALRVEDDDAEVRALLEGTEDTRSSSSNGSNGNGTSNGQRRSNVDDRSQQPARGANRGRRGRGDAAGAAGGRPPRIGLARPCQASPAGE